MGKYSWVPINYFFLWPAQYVGEKGVVRLALDLNMFSYSPEIPFFSNAYSYFVLAGYELILFSFLTQ